MVAAIKLPCQSLRRQKVTIVTEKEHDTSFVIHLFFTASVLAWLYRFSFPVLYEKNQLLEEKKFSLDVPSIKSIKKFTYSFNVSYFIRKSGKQISSL